MSPRHGVLLALLGASCVDLARPGARATRPAVVRERAAEDARERARREALPRLEPDRTPTDPNRIRRADDPRRTAALEGVRRYFFGPLRAEVRGDAVTVAPEVPAEGVFVVAARAARAWVFVTNEDEVLASDSFLGPLRRIGSLRCAPLPMDGKGLHLPAGHSPSAARVVLWSDRAAAWTDGASLRFERDARIRALAWRDEQHGARVVDEALESTDDGGRTWRTVQGAPGLPMALAGREGALLALTTEGTFRVDERGIAGAAPVPNDPPPDLSHAARDALMGAALERYARAPRHAVPDCTRAVRPAPSEDDLTPVAVSFPVLTEPSGMTYNPAPVERRAPLGSPERTAAALDASVMVTSAERPGNRTAFAWRAVDARGRFTTRAEVTLPEALRRTGWRALTATRASLLLFGECESSDPEVPCAGLVRVSPAGASLLPETSRLRDPSLAASGDDGSMAVLGDWRTPGAPDWALVFSMPVAPVAASVVVAPDGAVAARTLSLNGAVGLGERDGAWGLVSGRDGAWWFHGPDGHELPFGRWRADVVRPCVGASVGASRLHLNGGDLSPERPLASFACAGDCGPIAQAEGLTLRRRAGEAPCVERVRGVHTEYRDGTDGQFDQRQSVCFLSRGRTGVFIDRGDAVGFTSATVRANTFESDGY